MKKLLLSAVICGALLSPELVLAQNYPPGQSPQAHGAQPRGHEDNNRGRDEGFHDRGVREGWYRKGGHVPQAYRSNKTYVVSDYRTHHLKKPKRGYHWVHSDNGDFLLVAISTGIIASIIAGAN